MVARAPLHVNSVPCAQRVTALAALQRLLAAKTMDSWLAPGELETLGDFKAASRRQVWLAARWLAKRLVQRETGGSIADLRTIHIQSTNGRGRGDRPQVFVGGRLQAWSLSIAHSDHAVYVALATSPDVKVGVDVVAAEALGRGALAMWFTDAERAALAASVDPRHAARLWAAKEAAYKALSAGEPFTPRNIEITHRGETYDAAWTVGETTRRCRVLLRTYREDITALAIGIS